MDELTSSNIQVVLRIKEGKGFDQILHSTSLTASLNGHLLETNAIEASANPQYTTDLIWELDKITLRKLRSGQVTLKLECFAFKEDDTKDKVGYALLSIRSAQIVPRNKSTNVKYTWHKLLGLKSDIKPPKPELFLALCVEEQEIKPNLTIEKLPELESHRNPYGDCGQNISLCNSNCLMKYNTHNSDLRSHEALKICNSTSYHMLQKQEHLCACVESPKSAEAYHCYCLHIKLNAMTLLSTNLKIKDINFRFHHPKAQIMSTLYQKLPISSGEKVKFQDVGCKLQFISVVNEIKNLLLAFPPKLTIHDAGSIENIIFSECILDVVRLFHQSKLECQYEAPLFDANKKHIGKFDIMLHLEDQGPYYKAGRKAHAENFGPPILDDSLAYKIVDELETWKERQKEMFNFELKKKEERHLHILAEEWQKRKENLEVKLANSVEQCKSLALSLNNATEDLKSRRLKNLEKEAKLIQANEELKWRYESKLQEVREIYCALKDDLTAKISTLEDKNTMLEAKIEPLLTENDELKRTIMKQNEKLVLLEKDLLDQDETSSLHQELKLLKEKLHSTQNSKIFFKEQWAKAVREIHRITTEYQQVMEFQIKSSKEELENLDLEEMLSTDTTALATDRILLDQIQKEVDIMKPSLNLQWKEDENIFNIPDEYDSSVSRGKQQVESSTEHEKKLKKLMEERDTLLKTGSYNIDDSIIVNLNSEIRSLLLNN
ncbi:protein Daple-like isoform X2 [Prorops nasuta]|uniref:protein Daple-like isoform X2 n=1 Tax=Prorops nasuta TaxID=863751 RepID=UPI0034CE62FF